MNPFYQEPMATIYCGDALEVLKVLPTESVQMAMTSPPYWGLRNYAGGSDFIWGGEQSCDHQWIETTQGLQHENRNNLIGSQEEVVGKTGTAFIQKYDRLPSGICLRCGAWHGQLGLEPSPELYVEHLMMIFREVKRVLRKDGAFYLNIGDTYAGSGCGYGFPPDPKWPTARNNQDKQLEPRRLKTLPAKCMVCIPERVMFALLEDGWILRNKIIWHKPNNMPSSVKDRYTQGWEYLYFFGKNGNTILWRNRETGEWRDTKPTKNEKYPWGGIYQHKETGEFRWEKPPERDKNNWIKYQPLWMGFDHYFDLDAVRVPHTVQSLERYQRGVNLNRPAIGKSAEVGPLQQYTRAPEWFKEMFPPDEDYKGKFDDLFGHGPNPQSFNLRVRDVKRGKGGTFVQGDQVKELKASDKEVEEYDYPEKHHGSSMSNVGSLHRDRQKHESADLGVQKPARKRHSGYFGEDGQPLIDFAKGKNPSDLWSITTKPSSISVCPQCDTVFPRLMKICPNCKIEGVVGHFAPYPEKLCEGPINASSRIGDTVLDMFAGGGSTGVAAKRLGRKAILIDCVRPYCIMARYKLKRVEYQPELER